MLGGQKQRAVLAMLLLHANKVVSVDRLIEEVWGEQAPQSAKNSLQVYISRLRRLLGDRILTRPPGYLIRLEPEELDLTLFNRLASSGRDALAQGDAELAATRLREALSLWRGDPLSELELSAGLEVETMRLEEARLGAIEDRIEAKLLLGAHPELIDELERLTAEHPLRERLTAQLMVALYRSGRQAEALELYRKRRESTVAELGLEPSPTLQQLQRSILLQDPKLDAPLVVSEATAHPTRKQVTVLLADFELAGTADPEVEHRVLAPHIERATKILESHQAVVEHRLTEGLLASFGLPTVHEDDALRALRAAVELTGAFIRNTADGISIRAALETGEVLADRERLHGGDALSRVLALKDDAEAGEIVIGEGTYRLVRHVVRAEPIDPEGPWKLVEIDAGAEAIQRHFDGPLVGREEELDRLDRAFSSVVAERSCHLFTVVGSPGIGKSRLAREFATLVSDIALVLTGRCLPYGEGITFWPLVEIVREAAGDITATAVRRLIGDEESADLVAREVAGALGSSDAADVGEDAFWAVRRLFEALAHGRPLVVVFEDLHWAEPRLLDLVEHIKDLSRDAPILILCLARPEFLTARPSWGGGKPNTDSLLLNPLSEEGSADLIDIRTSGVSDSDRRGLIARVEGNPLFIEQMLALLEEERPELGEALPPTIQAVLTARLDLLDYVERTAIDCGSVIGLTFWLGAIKELAQEDAESEIRGAVARLVSKELIRPIRSSLRRQEAFRFQHILIRDVAYGSVLKETRAELHERFADWLDESLADRASEADEIVGYHLEQAYALHTELEPEGDWRELASRAGRHLAAAAQRAYVRSDMPAAANLLTRALKLVPEEHPGRGDLLVDLARALRSVGDWSQANDRLHSALALADRSKDPALWTFLVTQKLQHRLQTDPNFTVEEFVAKTARAFRELTSLKDERYITRVRATLAWGYALRGQAQRAEQLLQENIKPSAQYNVQVVNQARTLLPSLWLYGPLKVSEARRRCERLLDAQPPPRAEASCYRCLAVLEAMIGRFDEARVLAERDEELLDELGLLVLSAAGSSVRATVEFLAGETAAAVGILKSGLESLRKLGATLHLSEVSSVLARVLYAQEAYEEAWRVTELEPSGSHDVAAAVYWRGTRAKLLAQRGQGRRAMRLARQGMHLAQTSDLLDLTGDSLMDLSEVLRLNEAATQAESVVKSAIQFYERKGNIVSAKAARVVLADGTSTRAPA